MPEAQIVWYGRRMPFESWTDYLVAALWLIPVWAGAFAFGYRVAERQGWRAQKEAVESTRNHYRQILYVLRDRYGIEDGVLVRVNFNDKDL